MKRDEVVEESWPIVCVHARAGMRAGEAISREQKKEKSVLFYPCLCVLPLTDYVPICMLHVADAEKVY